MSGIMFDIKLVEGKGNPVEIPPDKYKNIGKMSGLFFLQLFHHLYSTCKVVILDNGFFVTQVIIRINKLGGGFKLSYQKEALLAQPGNW